jgi:hypothetical protein
MEQWTSKSNSGKQIVLSLVCTLAGLVLTVGFRNFSGLGSNALAGFLLGILLLLIGVAGILFSGTQTVVIDPKTRRITISDSNRFHATKKVIPFSSVMDVSIGYLGKKSNFVTWYYLILKLRSGEDYSLFAPGRFFEGGSDRSVVESWKLRLEKYLGSRDGMMP